MKTKLVTLLAVLGIMFCGCGRDPQRSSQLSFHRVSDVPADGSRPVVVNGKTVYLMEPAAILSPMVHDAYSSKDTEGRPYLFIKFAEPTTSDFAALSTQVVGKRLAIVISGETVAVPMLREPISNGVISVTGTFTEEKANAISRKILGLEGSVEK